MTRILTYVFPFILIAIEYCLRLALQTETTAFAGPALASASAGLLIPLTAPKAPSAPLSDEVRRELDRFHVTVRSKRDELLRAMALLLLLVSIVAWVWCLVLSERHDAATWWTYSRTLIVGMASYVIAVVASELKEAL